MSRSSASYATGCGDFDVNEGFFYLFSRAQPHPASVPDHFTSLETGKPFSHCCDCGCALEHTEMHIINKSYVGDECVFELAMCIDCREKMNEKLSEASKVAMFDFMHDHSDMEKREQELDQESPTEDYLAHCITCDKSREEIQNYTLGGMFSGHSMIKGPFPMLMCSECEDALAKTISPETRDMWDRFIGEHFPGPPSEVKLPTGSKPAFF